MYTVSSDGTARICTPGGLAPPGPVPNASCSAYRYISQGLGVSVSCISAKRKTIGPGTRGQRFRIHAYKLPLGEILQRRSCASIRSQSLILATVDMLNMHVSRGTLSSHLLSLVSSYHEWNCVSSKASGEKHIGYDGSG